MQELDLTRHDIEEVPGKTISINGVAYELQPLFGEGGTAFVFPLKNLRSGLILFVAKIMKFRPGSPEYNHSFDRMQKHDVERMCFIMEDAEIPVIPEEHYLVKGGMVRFQKFLGSVDNPEYFSDDAEKANAFAKARMFSRALEAYDAILSLNPYHTEILVNKSICLDAIGETPEAISLLASTIEIEPNNRSYYNLIAKIAANHGMSGLAVHYLNRAVQRCPWDYINRLSLAQIALDYDMIEIASKCIGESLRAKPTSKTFRRLRQELPRGGRRSYRYNDLLSQAASLQMKQRWEEAVSLCERAARISRNNAIALLNRTICLVQSGKGAPVAMETGSLIYRLHDRFMPTCALVAAQCFHQQNDYGFARRLLCMIEIPEEIADLPGIPAVVKEDGIIEFEPGNQIFGILDDLLEGADMEEAEHLLQLRASYQEYKKIFSSIGQQ